MQNAREFSEWKDNRLKLLADNEEYQQASLQWINKAVENDYPYLFSWFGVPVIQFPSDLVLMQEAIFRSRANKVVEVGIARGGTTVFLASLLKLIHGNEAHSVIGVDIKLSNHTIEAVRNSVVQDSIILIEGNSVSNETFLRVKQFINSEDRVLVILDSNHTHQHVYSEMMLYGGLVTSNSFLIVMDTAIEYVDQEHLKDKKWARGNSPLTAVSRYQVENPNEFVLDEILDSRSLPGAASGGFLKRL